MITLQTLPVLILWSVVIIRVVGLRFGWKPGILPACALVALAVTLNIDQLYLFLDGILGGLNLLNLIVHLLMGAGLTALSQLLLTATGRRSETKTKGLLVIGAVMTVIQTVLILISHTVGSATNFTDTFGHIPTVSAYQASFFGWIGLVLLYTGVQILRRDKTGESRSFGRGLSIVAVGCLSGVTAVAMKMLLIGLAAADIDAAFGLYLTYRIFVAIGVLCFSVGFILPSYDRIRAAFAARRRRAEDLDTLRPLVTRLVSTVEGVRSMDATQIDLSAKTSRKELYRWLIFIGDVKVLNPDLLNEEEMATVDKIGTDIDNFNGPADRASAGV